jgi:hypothetical protein
VHRRCGRGATDSRSRTHSRRNLRRRSHHRTRSPAHRRSCWRWLRRAGRAFASPAPPAAPPRCERRAIRNVSPPCAHHRVGRRPRGPPHGRAQRRSHRRTGAAGGSTSQTVSPTSPTHANLRMVGFQGVGAVAQLGERELCKLEVVGSIPSSSTMEAPEKSGAFSSRSLTDRGESPSGTTPWQRSPALTTKSVALNGTGLRCGRAHAVRWARWPRGGFEQQLAVVPGMGRYGPVWAGMGRYGPVWAGMSRYEPV